MTEEVGFNFKTASQLGWRLICNAAEPPSDLRPPMVEVCRCQPLILDTCALRGVLLRRMPLDSGLA
jgi:hypothetical protein